MGRRNCSSSTLTNTAIKLTNPFLTRRRKDMVGFLRHEGGASTSAVADSPQLWTSAGEARDVRIVWLHGLFFLSGFPALLYQIVWQRALFAIYGVNIQSVTIVVSAFMLGLGAGSLLGGILSKSRCVPLLQMFGLAELGIGAFGSVSLKILPLGGGLHRRCTPAGDRYH